MTGGHRFDPTIIREYDIRGIVDKTLTTEDARAIGRAFGTILREQGGKTVCVGYDGRVSSPELEAALCEGLTGTGTDVIRIGLGPTPMLYFAATTLSADGGIQITGSHNPPDQNGFKMMMGKASFFGEQLKKLAAVAASGEFAIGAGRAAIRDVMDDYVARLQKDFRPGKRTLAVGWDPGNGACGEVMMKLIAQLPGRHVAINEKIDGTFPNHHPDPTEPHNLKQLQDTVAREKLDLGIAFDGDGDRIGVIDSKGRILWGDQLMALYAKDVLSRVPGATIIADVKASQSLFDEVAKLGGKPLMWRTGHSLIKSKMQETKAALAGEMSGHIFFAEGYYGYDDALYAAVRLLSILSNSDLSLAELRDRMPQPVNTPELRFDCGETRKFQVIDEVKDRLKKNGAKVIDIDGVRVNTPDGWWLLRASNTQAVLVARAEAKDQAGLGRLKAALGDQLKASGVQPPAGF